MKRSSRLTIVLILLTAILLVVEDITLRLSIENNTLGYFFFYLFIALFGCLLILIKEWLGEMTVRKVEGSSQNHGVLKNV